MHILQSVWINEFHYDNTGADTGEFVEIAYTTSTDISDYTLVVYNGHDQKVLNSHSLSGGSSADEGVMVTSISISGLQNGVEGLALVDGSGTVVQFVSYEGSFTAADGYANGMTSTDVGVAESGSTNVGDSIQATGTGCGPTDFTWLSPKSSTRGSINIGQTFSCQESTVEPVDEAMTSQVSGTGTIQSIDIDAGNTKTIGYLPKGIADVYIELDSTTDADIQLFLGSTALIARSVSNSVRQHTISNGVRLEYSGFRGEDSSTTLGEEFLFLSGTLQDDLTLKIYGAETGTVTCRYNWGYYNSAHGKEGTDLKQSLHDIIDDHIEITYTAAWDAIKVR